MKRYLIIFQGRVQGVGFRYYTYTVARELGLTGSVKNLMNGNVEVEIQGDDPKITLFLKAILKGNGFIKVIDYAMKEIALKVPEKDFKITG
ncbi:MAG: acylphosphatase [Clostridiaceae bacterium]